METNHEAEALEIADKEVIHLRAEVNRLTQIVGSRRTCIHVNVAGDCSAIQRLKKELEDMTKERDSLRHQVIQLQVQSGDAY